MARKWKVLIVTAVAVFMAFLDVTIVNIAFPDMARHFTRANRADLSWVLNAYNVVFAALLVPAGRVADLVGRRRMFLIGVCGFVLASLACGLAASVPLLVAARVAQAAAAAVLVPASLGLVLPEFPAAQRATATSVWAAAGAVAAAAGPSLGGVIVQAGSWRWAFLLNLPIGLAALVPAARLLREHLDPSAKLPDWIGTLLLAVGVGALALGIVEGPDRGWENGRVLASFAAALVLLAAFLVRSARHPTPVVELGMFRLRSFAVAVTGMLTFSVAFYALLLGNVLFLTEVWSYSILAAGIALTPGPLAAAVAASLGGRLADRYGQRAVILPGAVLFTAGCALLALGTGVDPDYVRDLLPAQLLTGAGVGLNFASWGSAAVAQMPPARFATASAISSGMRQVGAVVGVAGLIAVLEAAAARDPLTGFHTAWALMAAVGVLAGVIAVALGRVRAGVAQRVTG